MASTIITEISCLDLLEIEIPTSASVTDVKHLSSYNWIQTRSGSPAIAVPGSPALWSPPTTSSQLKKDSALIHISQDASCHPDSPLESLFRALYSTHPSFDIRSIDVVTDRNSIRKLLTFVDPGSNKYGSEEFTIDIEVNKNTAIFCRHEAKVVEYIGPDEFRGYGHEFVKAYTVSQIKDSIGHHRIISALVT